MTTTSGAPGAITIKITETIEHTFRLTPAELEEFSLPTTVEELEALDADEVGVTLIDQGTPDDYAVTERDVEVTSGDDEDTAADQ